MKKVDFERAARGYVERLGWQVFPLAEGAKTPAIRGGHGVKDASQDLDVIARWAREYPHANIGLACGEPSGITVIDIDPRHGGPESLAALAAKGHVLPPCPRASTGNGGWHYFYRYAPGILNSKSKLGPGIDIKTTGGYVVAAPSWTASSDDGPGGSYVWEVSPLNVAVPRLPIWVSSLLAPRPIVGLPQFSNAQGLSGAIGDLEGAFKYARKAPVGSRNNTFYWLACRSAEAVTAGKMGQSETCMRLVRTGAEMGLDPKEVPKTIASAFQTVRGRK